MKVGLHFIICGVFLCLGGCKNAEKLPPQVETVDSSNSKMVTGELSSHALMSQEDAVIRHWREIAHSKSLRWQIRCDDEPDSPSEMFFGAAWPDGSKVNGYIEDGVLPFWSVTGNSQQQVAARLYSAIQGPPNRYPKHRPKWHPAEKECPSPLSGN